MGRGGGKDENGVTPERLLYGQPLRRIRSEDSAVWVKDLALYLSEIGNRSPLSLIGQEGEEYLYWIEESTGYLKRRSLTLGSAVETFSFDAPAGELVSSGYLDRGHFIAWETADGGHRIAVSDGGNQPQIIEGSDDQLLGNTTLLASGDSVQIITPRDTYLQMRSYDRTGRQGNTYEYAWGDGRNPSLILDAIDTAEGPQALVSTTSQDGSQTGLSLITLRAGGLSSVMSGGQGPVLDGPKIDGIEDAHLIADHSDRPPAAIARTYDQELLYWNGQEGAELIKLTDQANRFGSAFRSVRSSGRDYVVWSEQTLNDNPALHCAVLDPDRGLINRFSYSPESPGTVADIQLSAADGQVDLGWTEFTGAGIELATQVKAASIRDHEIGKAKLLAEAAEKEARVILRSLERNGQGKLQALVQNRPNESPGSTFETIVRQ